MKSILSFNLGDFPDIQVVPVVNSSSVTFSVTEDTAGTPDIDTVALEMEGVVSQPFQVSTLTAGSVSRHEYNV